MIHTPLAERLRFVLFGKRNAGKSSLINNLAEKPLAIVSSHPGTTTDPVIFPMELGELGPVAFVDTAGLDDEGELGELRIQKTRERLLTADVGIFVTPSCDILTQKEEAMLREFQKTGRPLLIVFTFYTGELHPSKQSLTSYPWVGVDNTLPSGIPDVRKRLLSMKDLIQREPELLEGLVKENDFVLLVTPIDLAAPKGRLILPQVETIRELLDRDCGVMVVKERELSSFYHRLGIKPALVITDSQAFHKVAADLPFDQKLTSFSLLMARKKGNLLPFVESLRAFSHFPPGGKVLILEACSHHRQPDDIGTVKIPRLFTQMVEPTATFSWKKHLTCPEEVEGFNAVIMCGGCMVSRRHYEYTMSLIQEKHIPILNYGLFLAWVHGLLPRAIEMFPEAYERYLALYT
ncbi:MAG: [FeFe] hydrogenase H-cluster maturation GTPase HydF [Brevinematales bacterium]|nr:[FeFe] hydrogenase H-cluster maturation GTPase HydF [Brevinematales bacterium]